MIHWCDDPYLPYRPNAVTLSVALRTLPAPERSRVMNLDGLLTDVPHGMIPSGDHGEPSVTEPNTRALNKVERFDPDQTIRPARSFWTGPELRTQNSAIVL
jgi:hypothetical protein